MAQSTKYMLLVAASYLTIIITKKLIACAMNKTLGFCYRFVGHALLTIVRITAICVTYGYGALMVVSTCLWQY